jgi:hypothetical protein
LLGTTEHLPAKEVVDDQADTGEVTQSAWTKGWMEFARERVERRAGLG